MNSLRSPFPDRIRSVATVWSVSPAQRWVNAASGGFSIPIYRPKAVKVPFLPSGGQPPALALSTQHLQGFGLALTHRAVQRGSHSDRLQTWLGTERAQQGQLCCIFCTIDPLNWIKEFFLRIHQDCDASPKVNLYKTGSKVTDETFLQCAMIT